jgi:DNA adenine methylase
MTAYHGGKTRTGNLIANVIYNEALDIEDVYDFTIKGYCEPFAGMLGVYRHIPVLFKDHKPKLKYMAGDFNKSLILMWKALQEGWKPPTTITKKEYDSLRYSKDSAKKGFIGNKCGFGGLFFGQYRKELCTSRRIKLTLDKIKKIIKDIKNTKFKSGSYTQYSKLKGYVIYCDPPYSKYNRYVDSENKRVNFDNKKFWNWCRKMAKDNIVFVSEYKAPKDFQKIWSKNVHTQYNKVGVDNKENIYLIF